MYMACIVVVLVSALIVIAGVRVRGLVPRHWVRVQGEWLGPALRWSPSRYQYVTEGGDGHAGVSRVRVAFRPPYGGTCMVAYDPAMPSRSQPAQLRWNGTMLIWVGIVAGAAGVVLMVLALQ